MILKLDCRYFPGDRPCVYNKTIGIKCDVCSYYSPVKNKILIIKLDALGDVLRTTSILHAVREKYPDSYLTWITKNNAKNIFRNNPLVDEVLSYEDPQLINRLHIEKFIYLLNPDASIESSSLAALADSAVKKGYILNELGKVVPVNKEAEEWLEMGAFDDLKKQNTKTYQQIIHEIAGLEYKKGEIIINLTEDELKFKNEFIKNNKLENFDYLIGLNTGASRRWRLKQWRQEGFEELISKLSCFNKIGILLFGGEEETERNKYLRENFNNVIDTGNKNSLREFFALMDIPDLVITGDTLALHTAAALKKEVICLFGPTSYNEIEDYGRITKIYPDMECLVCYKQDCNFIPNCMDLISTDMILSSINNILTKSGSAIVLT